MKLVIQKGLKQVLALFVAFFTIIHTFLSIFAHVWPFLALFELLHRSYAQKGPKKVKLVIKKGLKQVLGFDGLLKEQDDCHHHKIVES